MVNLMLGALTIQNKNKRVHAEQRLEKLLASNEPITFSILFAHLKVIFAHKYLNLLPINQVSKGV